MAQGVRGEPLGERRNLVPANREPLIRPLGGGDEDAAAGVVSDRSARPVAVPLHAWRVRESA
jgi:hypothetical protein